MAINKLRDENFAFLDKMTGKEKVGMDKQGRLYEVVQKSSVLQSLFSRIFPDKRKEQLTSDYARLQFAREDFANDPKCFLRYQQLLNKLSASGLVTDRNRAEITGLYYNARWLALWKSGLPHKAAEAVIALEKSQDPFLLKKPPLPVATTGGASGSYFIQNDKGENLAVIKPQDEEYGMPNGKTEKRPYDPANPLRGILREGYVQGTAWQREVAAYRLDAAEGHAGVPFTTEVLVPLPGKQGEAPVYKKCSMQLFAKGDNVVKMKDGDIAAIPDKQIQKIAAFDLMIDNGDRNLGNILYDKETQVATPIDHGCAFLDTGDWQNAQSSDMNADWATFPQVKKPINAETKKWILDYPLDAKCEQLKQLGMSDSQIRAHKLRVLFLKEGVRQGFTLYELAKLSMNTKENYGMVPLFDKIVVRTVFQRRMGLQNEPAFLEAFQKNVTDELAKLKGAHG